MLLSCIILGLTHRLNTALKVPLIGCLQWDDVALNIISQNPVGNTTHLDGVFWVGSDDSYFRLTEVHCGWNFGFLTLDDSQAAKAARHMERTPAGNLKVQHSSMAGLSLCLFALSENTEIVASCLLTIWFFSPTYISSQWRSQPPLVRISKLLKQRTLSYLMPLKNRCHFWLCNICDSLQPDTSINCVPLPNLAF